MARSKNARDVIIPCSGGGHRVRLGRGRRFWAPARCPVCKSPVDPRRTLRLVHGVLRLRAPASGRFLDAAVWWGSMGFLALALLATGMVWVLGDRWWPATVLLFGPRWVLLLPGAFLLPLVLIRDRALAPVLGLAGLLIVGPVMGLRTGWRSLLPGAAVSAPLTVVTLNAQVGGGLYTSLANLLSEWDADVAAFQECGGHLARQLRTLPGWYTDARSGLCLASRFEILEVLEMDREALQFAGGAGIVVTYRLSLDPGPVYLTNLHLDTPREGFELIRAGHLRSGIQEVREKSLLRSVELRRARFWTDRFEGPHIVVGDFNTPVESRAYQTSWGDWTNAFSDAGSGFGGTRLNGWIRVRIDHVLANDEWQTRDAWVEGDVGSDHLPMAARLSLR